MQQTTNNSKHRLAPRTSHATTPHLQTILHDLTFAFFASGSSVPPVTSSTGRVVTSVSAGATASTASSAGFSAVSSAAGAVVSSDFSAASVTASFAAGCNRESVHHAGREGHPGTAGRIGQQELAVGETMYLMHDTTLACIHRCSSRILKIDCATEFKPT